MKKYFKYTFITILCAVVILLVIFRNRIMLTYNLVHYVVSLKDNKVSYSFNNMETLKTMDHKNIVYKKVNGRSQTLDIYSSKKETDKLSPVILYVHGGSWAYGDKSIPQVLSPVLEMLREQGYTIISTSYELMKDKVIFEYQVSDVKDTIRWIYKNGIKYNIDKNEIGIIGISSGAHLGLIASYSDNNHFIGDPSLKQYNSKVKYIIDFSGPTELSTLNIKEVAPELYHVVDVAHNKDLLINSYTPLNYVNKNIPSTLIIHSKADSMVPYVNSTVLYTKIKENKGKARMVSLSSSDHTLKNISQDDIKLLVTEILKFIILNSPL